MLPWIFCGLSLLLHMLLLCVIHSRRRALEEICSQLALRLKEDTNNLIYVSSRDPHIRRLAAQLSAQLALLRQNRLRYESGDRELREAITNISHDLRTPLTAISGYLELLEREEYPDTTTRYLAQIRSRTEAMKKLTGELFDYSLTVSAPCGQTEALTLNAALEESLAACYGQLNAAGITPRIQMPDIPVRRQLDKISLERVLGNLLGNAAKYSAGDLEILLSPDGLITFSNAAPGLTPVMAERLFDRFYTVEAGRRSTGLGLAIARTLTQRMGGTITASCREGRLCVTLFFPDSAAAGTLRVF